MNNQQADHLVKALVDGVDSTEELALRAGVPSGMLTAHRETIERAISLIHGFHRFASENMKPAGLPPPKNPYLNREAGISEQAPEYFAFEAVQRGNMNRDKAIQTCIQLGVDEGSAATAVDNVCMPWRETNGWRSYVKQKADGRLVLMDKPPVKIKRHLERLHDALAG